MGVWIVWDLVENELHTVEYVERAAGSLELEGWDGAVWDVWWLFGEGGVEAEDAFMEDVGGVGDVERGVVDEDLVGGVEGDGEGGHEGHEIRAINGFDRLDK